MRRSRAGRPEEGPAETERSSGVGGLGRRDHSREGQATTLAQGWGSACFPGPQIGHHLVVTCRKRTHFPIQKVPRGKNKGQRQTGPLC